ncbi:MAG: UDP-N-acetylmuramoyl-L-alanine--D-glutamate ligase [bacterium]|nr:UDP-N-acetylmuramoyl-L-alanine--D-glutamate ligase [bacterium]
MCSVNSGDIEGKMTTHQRIKDRKIGIVGMARSGVAAAILAKQLGGIPFVSDAAPIQKLEAQFARLKENSIDFEAGGHTARILDSDYIILSPGVRLDIDILQKARSKGIPCFSEIEFASWVCRGTIVAVTGSNGKTTTTTLIGEMFKAGGVEAVVCGNVGLPFSEVAANIPINGVAVVEVSTFQLESVEEFNPHIALILNLSPDHLDRHGSFDNYKQLKYRLAENQTENDWLILNEEDKTLTRDKIKTGAKRAWFTTKESATASAFVSDGTLMVRIDDRDLEVLPVSDIRIPGPHNLQNSAAASVAASLMGIGPDAIAEALRAFTGVEHRMERVGKIAGIEFINDSKATNVDSVCYALRSVSNGLYLIAGGREKGASYAPIIEFGRDKIKGIVAIGEAREKIFSDLGKSFSITTAGSLEEAVNLCFEMARPGETVLLSPACASFDMFTSFEHRGRVFKEAVAALRRGKNSSEKVQS